MQVSEKQAEEAYNKNKQFYDDLMELQAKVEDYKEKCTEQEKKARSLLILQQKLQIRTDFLEKYK